MWAAFCLAGGAAHAADKPRIGPPEAWVLPPPAALAPAKASAGAALALLSEDVQVRFDATGQSTFMEVQAKVQSAQGLAALGTVSLPWSPATDILTVHRLRILRDGQVIDRLPKDGAFTVIRREARLETAAMLDGVLTAVVQPEGLQVGDVLDIAYTLRREDPLLKGRIDADLMGFDAAPLGALRVRALWPKGSGVSWRVANGLGEPRLSEHDGQVEARIEAQEVSPLAKPQGAPPRFKLGRELTVSNYADWAAVSALMAPLFTQAEQLPPGSPVAAEAKAIAARSADPAVRTQAALALVQDKVRYFAQAIGDGGLKPATADETWTRRWGDCKAKTALLLALLKALGVQAEPVLASSIRGVGLDGRLPALSAFDHVLVRATVAGKDYWLDGTRLGDASLAAIPVPDFGFVLPLRPQGATLIPLRPPPEHAPLTHVAVRIDATGGIDKPAPFHVESVFRGDAGLALKLQLANLAPDDLDRALRAYWRERYDFVEVAKVSVAYDGATGGERLVMDGSAKLDWSGGGYEADGASLGWRYDAHRDPGPHADAPFAVAYPSYDLNEETIQLPDHGRGFSVWGEDVDKELEGYAFKRRPGMENGAFHIETSSRALVPEIGLAQAQADAGPLTEMSKDTVRLRDPQQTTEAANDGKVNTAKPDALNDYLIRVSSLLKSANYAVALKEFDSAVAFDPSSSSALALRGLTLAFLGQMAASAADFDKAEALDPKGVIVWNARAYAAQQQDRWADVVDASSHVLAAAPDQEDMLRLRAYAYKVLRRYELALADVDDALKLQPEDAALKADRIALLALTGDRAAAKRELTQTGTKGSTPSAHFSRAQMLVAMGDRAGALAEADQLVKAEPTADSYVFRATVRDPSDTAGLRADAEAAYALDHNSYGATGILANLNLRKGNLDSAIFWLQKATTIEPKNPQPWETLAGATIMAHHDPEAARRDFANVRRLAASDADQLNSLCDSQAKLSFDLETALGDCDASLRLRPGDAHTLNSSAFLLLRLGRDAEAKAAYDASLAARPAFAGSLYGRSLAERRLGDAAAADRDLAAAKAADPQVEIPFARYGVGAVRQAAAAPAAKLDDLLKAGDAALDQRRFTEGLSFFEQAAALDPESSRAWASRGLAHAWLGHTQAARADLAHAETLDSRQIVVWHGRAVLAANVDRSAEVIAACTQALAIRPRDVFCRGVRADAYLDLKDDEAAREDLEAGLQLDPANPGLRGAMTIWYGRRKLYDKARAEAAEIAIPGGDAGVQDLARVQALALAGDREGARDAVDRALAVHRTCDLLLARAALRDRDADAAERAADLRDALALNPRSAAAYRLAAQDALHRRDAAAAQRAADRMLALQADDESARLFRGEAMTIAGNGAAAAQDFARLRANAGDRAPALNNLCFGEATSGFDLAQAQADCDAALRLAPDMASALDSRAFVLLRARRDREAKAAYDASLAVRPASADSLYGRSLVERRLGDPAAADKDLKAAVASDAEVVATFAGYGVTR